MGNSHIKKIAAIGYNKPLAAIFLCRSSDEILCDEGASFVNWCFFLFYYVLVPDIQCVHDIYFSTLI